MTLYSDWKNVRFKPILKWAFKYVSKLMFLTYSKRSLHIWQCMAKNPIIENHVHHMMTSFKFSKFKTPKTNMNLRKIKFQNWSLICWWFWFFAKKNVIIYKFIVKKDKNTKNKNPPKKYKIASRFFPSKIQKMPQTLQNGPQKWQ